MATGAKNWKNTFDKFAVSEAQASGNSWAKARSSSEIKSVTKRLKRVWLKVPRMSFAELVYEVFDCCTGDPSELTDEQLVKKLERRFG